MTMLDAGRNLTYQLTHQLGAAIIQGQYAVDKTFPTEAELSQQFNISCSVSRIGFARADRVVDLLVIVVVGIEHPL